MKEKFFAPHGGAVFHFAKLLTTATTKIIDLSSSVNHLVLKYLSGELLELIPYVNTYPPQTSEEVSEFMEEVISLPWQHTLWGNGSLELLWLCAMVFLKDKQIILLEPSFVGYTYLLKRVNPKGLRHFFSLSLEDWISLLENPFKSFPKVEAIMVCNPNNPTGWLIPKDILWDCLLKYPKVIFFVDEAFIDFMKEESLLTLGRPPKNLFVFRSLSKFYGLAGMRLGYVVSHPENLSLLRRFQLTWPVQTVPLLLAKKLMKHQALQKETLTYFERERVHFVSKLQGFGVHYFLSHTNYVLFKLNSGLEFWHKLLRERGILLRNCGNFWGLDGDFLRISLKERSWTDLVLEEVRAWVGG